MKIERQQSKLQAAASDLEGRVIQLREQVNGLTAAATLDMIGKVDQLDTMVTAMQRDADEVARETGANFTTAEQLYAVTESKLTSLEQEIDALSLGNPTTISAVVDAIVNFGSKK